MNQTRSYPLILQRPSPLPDQHIERSSGNTVCIIQTRHSLCTLDRAKCRGDEDELLGFAGTDEREEGADHNAVVDDLEFQFLFEEWQVSIP